MVKRVEILSDDAEDGEWTTGDRISITLRFSEDVEVSTGNGVPSVTLRIGDAVRVLGLTDDTGNSGVTMSVVNGTPSLILSDERQVPRVIMGIDSTTLEPILLTLDAEGNETWRSGPAGGT